MRVIPRLAVTAVLVADGTPPRPAWIPAMKARRLDPLTALACAAVDRLGTTLSADAAVAVGTAWGNADATQRFIDGLREFGDAGGSPTAFTTSVHHNPAGTLGELLGLHGPVATISSGGISGLAALRWAWLQVAAGRAPEALVVAADQATDWVRHVVTTLAHGPHPVGGGATALLLRADGPGRRIAFVAGGIGPCCDAGGSDAAEESLFARRAGGRRRSAAAMHGRWWPTAALAAAPWDAPDAIDFHERSGRLVLDACFSTPS